MANKDEIVTVKAYSFDHSFAISFLKPINLTINDSIEFPRLSEIGTISGFAQFEVIIHKGKPVTGL